MRSTATGSAHVGHIMGSWPEAPEQMGLMAVAFAELEVAAQHAALAVRSAGDLDALQAHAGHVLHALDPSRTPRGPGLGYGLIKAASDIANHIRLAAQEERSPPGIQNRVDAVSLSAENVADIAGEMLERIQDILEADSEREAVPAVAALQSLSTQLRAGRDRDGDDVVRWWDGEGGLGEVQRHMVLLIRRHSLLYGNALMPDPMRPDPPRADPPPGE